MSVTFPTMSGYSAFWERTGDLVPYSPLARAQQGWRSKLEWQLSQLFAKQQMREIKELMYTLVTGAVGDTALATYARVQPPTDPSAATPAVTGVGDLGGNRPIETVTVINRATTAADITYLQDILNGEMQPGPSSLTLVADAGGNGGGGKAGW